MKKAFLTHGWCDDKLVSQFGVALEKQDVPVFLDKWDISKGAMVWTTIDKAIDDASKLILFLSRDALQGKGVKEELDRGLQKAYEKHGKVFIVPVALDPYDDIKELLPIRVRGGNMVRAYDQSFDQSVQEIQAAVLDQPIPRTGATMETDFYYRLYPFSDALVIELGSGIQMLAGFALETIWPEPVKYLRFGLNPSGHPDNVHMLPMHEASGLNHTPSTPDTRLYLSCLNATVSRSASIFFIVQRPDGTCAPAPSKVRLYDRFNKLIRDPLPQTASTMPTRTFNVDIHA